MISLHHPSGPHCELHLKSLTRNLLICVISEIQGLTAVWLVYIAKNELGKDHFRVNTFQALTKWLLEALFSHYNTHILSYKVL